MVRLGFVAALTLLGLAHPAMAKPADSAQAAPLDPAIWRSETVAGPVIHRASNVAFPSEIGGFSRIRTSAVSATDVAVGYRMKQGETEVTATVYLFKPSTLPEHRLKGALTAFGTLSPTAFVWTSGPLDLRFSPPLRAWKGVFKTGLGPDTVMDYLYLVELGGWTVKVRATMQRAKTPETEGRIDDFVRALPWAQVLAASGSCAGAACSVPAFDAIENHYIEMMVWPLISRQFRFDSGKEGQLPMVGTVAVGKRGDAEIRRSNADPLVYVARAGGGATYRLIKLPPPFSALLEDVFGKLSIDKPLYGLVIENGGKSSMPRMFNGEPTAEAFGAAVRDFATHTIDDPFVTVAAAAAALPD